MNAAKLLVRTMSVMLLSASALMLAPSAAAGVSSSFSSGALTVSSDASDSIEIECDTQGRVLVDGANPDSGVVLCASVTSITATAGPEGSMIDLNGVTTADFTSLTSSSIVGGAGPDSLAGSRDFADQIQGGGGDDTLAGYGGADTLDGGPGSDLYSAQTLDAGAETIVDGAGELDELLLYGTGGNDAITFSGSSLTGGALTMSYGGLEALTISGDDGNDTVDLSAMTPLSGWVSVAGATGDDTLIGSPGQDFLDGNDGNDTLVGNGGDDGLRPGPGPATLNGGAGDDTYWLSDGAKTYTDSSGVDTLDFRALTAPISLDLALDAGQLQSFAGGSSAALTGTFENAIGTPFTDTLVGAAADNNLGGWGGADQLDGRGGSDVYELFCSPAFGSLGPTTAAVADTGNSGSDTLLAHGTTGPDAFVLSSTRIGCGADSFTFTGIEGQAKVYGYIDDTPTGTGDDTFTVNSAPTGGFRLDGQDGSDAYVVHFGDLAGALSIADSGADGNDSLGVDCSGTGLAPGTASNGSQLVTYTGVEQVPDCTPPATTVPIGIAPPPPPSCPPRAGASGSDRLVGTSCGETIRAGGGKDVVKAGAGDDVVYGGAGNDRLYGGAGADTLFGGIGNDFLSGGVGRDGLLGGRGTDRIEARDGERDVVDCGPGEDTVRADRRDVLRHCEHVRRS